MRTEPATVMFCRFPYQNAECPDSVNWVIRAVRDAKKDPRVKDVLMCEYDDTPITMTRNRAAVEALRHGADLVVMIDSDMSPELPGEKPFWERAFDFWWNHDGPSIVAAPYCGPPPCCNVYAFRWANWMNPGEGGDQDMRLEQFCREEAAARAGYEEVAAMPTGLMLIDAEVFRRVLPPWFYYEWTDETQSRKASTEDVTFTRDATLQGIPVYCDWSSWAGHWKRYRVDKPRPLTVDQVREKFVKAAQGKRHSAERLVLVREGKNGKKAPAVVAG